MSKDPVKVKRAAADPKRPGAMQGRPPALRVTLCRANQSSSSLSALLRLAAIPLAAAILALCANAQSGAGGPAVDQANVPTKTGAPTHGDFRSSAGTDSSGPSMDSSTGSASDSEPNSQAAGSTAMAPLTFGGKFRYYAKDYISPFTYVSPAFAAGIKMANPPRAYPREWRQGAKAFGRNYGDVPARSATSHTAKFITGAILREDPRYFPSTSKGVFARVGHAISFTFIDKSDSGHNTLAVSNFASAAAGGFVANAYLPRGYNDASHALSRSAVAFAGFAGQNLSKEFSPEIRALAKKLHIPFVH